MQLGGEQADRAFVRRRLGPEQAEPARRGRPRVMLRLDPTAGYVLAVKISRDSIVLQLADFDGLGYRYDEARSTKDRPVFVHAKKPQN